MLPLPTSAPAPPPPPPPPPPDAPTTHDTAPRVIPSPQRPTESTVGRIPEILPHGRMFPIQIGTELFKLSGLSLSSDAPSYFSQSFRCQLERARSRGDHDPPLKMLCIDRDPVTFRDIALHLQGYHVRPRNSEHLVRLYADAQFYNLPKLMSRLSEELIFVTIGGREFQLSRSLFADPGNSPNYFTLGFSCFHPSDAPYPGLDRDLLVRPPSIQPPSVPHRSADVFTDLVDLLRGDAVEFRSLAHRQSLIRECRYYMFKGLEQKLIPHKRAFNQTRLKDEIMLRLEDVLKSGISVVADVAATAAAAAAAAETSHPVPTSSIMTPSPAGTPAVNGNVGQGRCPSGWVYYARPYVDASPAELILETGNESARLHMSADGVSRVEFFNDTGVRIARLLEVIATKLNLPSTTRPLGLLVTTGGVEGQPSAPCATALCDQDRLRVVIDKDSAVELDGRSLLWTSFAWTSDGGGMHADVEQESDGGARKRRRTSAGPALDLPSPSSAAFVPGTARELIVKSALWRLRIQGSQSGTRPAECVLVAVRLDAWSCEATKNASRTFLGGQPPG